MDLNLVKRKSREISWKKLPREMFKGTIRDPHWFLGGYLNACVACLDSKQSTFSTKILYWESENGDRSDFTYGEIFNCVCQIASELKNAGLSRGDKVAVLLPQIPEAVFSALACARLGLPFSFIFTGFSKSAIIKRINDLGAKALITTPCLYRSGKILLSSVIKGTRAACPKIEKIFYFPRSSCDLPKEEFYRAIKIDKAKKTSIEPVYVESNHPLFIVYTSGTTGQPKYIVHSTGGFLVYAKATFDEIIRPEGGKKFFSTADFGWITGITYGIFAPLLSETPQLIYEGAISNEKYKILGKLINKYTVGSFYSSPSAFRLLKSNLGQAVPMTCLDKILSIGERLDEPTRDYIYRDFGRLKCAVVNTYFQSETGGIVLYSRADAKVAAGMPFADIGFSIKSGKLYINESWPGQMIGSNQNYFAGDSTTYCTNDLSKKVGSNYLILGRSDDVMNISGHRICGQDIEEAVRGLDFISECVVRPVDDEMRGQKAVILVVLKKRVADYEGKILLAVEERIGRFVLVQQIQAVRALPATFSGKLVRKIRVK